MEYSDLMGRVDKLSEMIAVFSERFTRVEEDQRAMRSSIDQLTGAFQQMDKRLGALQWMIGIIATLIGLYLAGITFPLVRHIITTATTAPKP